MFSDPRYKFVGSLEDAKKKGERENKWVLINIQVTENFTSHVLNRDIWKDKELGPVVQASFVFYQWVNKTDNAKRVINLYRPSKFPCILVVDPATGRQEHDFVVPDTPDKVSTLKSKIIEFLDDHPNPKAKPKKVIPKHIPTKDMVPQTHEDQLLQQALAASLADNADSNTNNNTNTNTNHNTNANADDADSAEMDEKSAYSPMEEDQPQEEEEEEVDLEAQLEPQPDGKDPNATAIRIRMPNGGVLQRYFMKEAMVSQLYIWCTLSLNGKKVSLLQTMPRLRLDDQKEKTLKALGLIRATLVCSYEDD